MTLSGRVRDVWRGRTKGGQDALGVELDLCDPLRCFWAPYDGTGPEPVARGDRVTASPHHYTVNGGPQRPRWGWQFDRTASDLYTG